MNSIVSLPGNLSAKDKENGVQVSPEKKVRRAKLVGYTSSEVSIVSCLLRFLELWTNMFLGALHRNFSYPVNHMYTRFLSRMLGDDFIFVSLQHGSDGAMEVCFVHITTSTNRPDFLFFSIGKHCCAIDYILCTVDSATALLNSPRRSSSVIHTT